MKAKDLSMSSGTLSRHLTAIDGGTQAGIH
jgi:hypothetical protein